MDDEPLLFQYASPRLRPPPLLPLPEDGEIALPPPLTPSELKDRLIFGPSPPRRGASPIAAAAAAAAAPLHHPARPSSSSYPPEAPPPTPEPPEQPQSWLIDPNFFWSKSNLHRSKTAPAMAVINDLKRQGGAPPKPQFASPSIIRQAVVLLVLYLSLGVVIYWFNRGNFSATETHPVVDALYFCIVTMCTIGYGDITPNSVATKLFSIMFVLVGFGFVDILLTGMVSYVLDLQENYMLRSVKGDGEKKDLAGTYIFDLKKGRMRIRMKVALALGVVVICIGVGFKSMPGRIFASIWLLVSTLAVARAFLFLAEARVDKRQRRVAKWVLGQDMTIAEFLAADMDNNGFVSKSEYVIYKLKEMKKVSEKDIMQICNKFDRLDTGKCGKITLADLMESRH
ncbi:hypothetical protein NL676_012635 [Syzygium grande]|nr:hypothetical protein NL676_012635 [Syzygium grande]